MAETPGYLQSKAAKYALGIHRGPLPEHDVSDPEAAAAFEHLEKSKTISLERTNTKSTITQTVSKHWKRFWCCYLVGNVIFLAIFLPIFFCICIPAIAQRVVDNSDLVLVTAKLMNPQPDSVVMTIKSALKLPLALPVKIDAFPLSLLVRDMPGNNTYAKVYIPESTIKGNTTLGEDDHPTPLNLPVWQEFVNRAMFNPSVELSVRGTTVDHLGELTSTVTMNKDVPLRGLNNFEGFRLEDTTLKLPALKDGTNLLANATLPNPSPFVLEIGDTVFDVKSGDLVLGNATLDHLILEKGTNQYPLHGILDLGKLISNLPEVLKQQRDSIMKGELSLTTVGKSVTYQGHTVEYYEKPLKKLVLPAKVQIGSLLINTLHDLLNKDGKNVLADNSSQSTNLTHVVDKIQNQSDSSSGSGGLLGSLLGGGSSKDSGGGDLLGSLKDSLHSRDLDLSGLLDDPDHLATVLKRFV